MYCCNCSTASTMVPQYLAALLFLCLLTSGKCTYSSVKSSSDDGKTYSTCNQLTYDEGSELEGNVSKVLKTLTENGVQSGFSTAISSTVYGRFQCRGDAFSTVCGECAKKAVEALAEDCPRALGARLQMEYCFIRYENYTFISQLDTNYWFGLANDNSNNNPHFNATMVGLMADLLGKASSSRIRFALGQREVPSSNVTIYGMEMCWRDMSVNNCTTCLNNAINEHLYRDFKDRIGARIFMGSCSLRYEIVPFAKNQ